MRAIAKTLVALGFVGTTVVGASSPTLAQGVYIQAPGVEFGIGRPAYRERYHRYYDYDRDYDRSYYRSYRYHRPECRYYRRGGEWDWD